jgi:hypothetical protein
VGLSALAPAAREVAWEAVSAARRAMEDGMDGTPGAVVDTVTAALEDLLGPGAAVTVDTIPTGITLAGATTYERLDAAALTTPADHYTGLYLAAFGSGGPELVLVRRETADERAAADAAAADAARGRGGARPPPPPTPDRGGSGSSGSGYRDSFAALASLPHEDSALPTWPAGADTIVGVRLAGDEGGRGGGIVFRAALGRAGRLAAAEAYPPELGVRGRYKAVGYLPDGAGEEEDDDEGDDRRHDLFGMRAKLERVGEQVWARARPGSTPPAPPPRARPVAGELLEFSGKAPVTRDAGLGFVWAAPGDRRHLCLVTRVALDDVGGAARGR